MTQEINMYAKYAHFLTNVCKRIHIPCYLTFLNKCKQKNTHFLTKEYKDRHITKMKVTQLDAGLRANSLSSVFSPEFRFTKGKSSMKDEKLIVLPTTHTCYILHICTELGSGD